MKNERKLRRSQTVVLLLGGALATTMGPAGCSSQDDDNVPPPPPPNTGVVQAGQVQDNQDLDNNSYVPGIGYYHSPFHTWFPYPFNWYYPGRGYFYGGSWNPTGYSGVVPARSRPTSESLGAMRDFVRGSSSSSRTPTGGFSGGGYHPGSVIRGGFGHSSHFSSGS